jgi:hypothetical protein
MAIPNEYLNSSFDFGFSAVDEAQAIVTVQQPVQSAPSEELIEPILTKLVMLERTLAIAMETLDRLEQAGTPNLDTDEYKSLISRDVKGQLKTVERMIMPLLVNLMKNPEKDYIKWPNRTAMIEKFIEQLLAVTRA